MLSHDNLLDFTLLIRKRVKSLRCGMRLDCCEPLAQKLGYFLQRNDHIAKVFNFLRAATKEKRNSHSPETGTLLTQK